LKDSCEETFQTLREDLEAWLKGARRIAVVGIGNPLRGDDAVGLEIVKRMKGKVSENVLLVEGETVPENYVKEVVEFDPSHVLMIDATMLNKSPGCVQFVGAEALGGIPVSTHQLPLSLFSSFLSALTETKVGLLGVQPGRAGLEERLSKEVGRTVNHVVEFLPELLEGFSKPLREDKE